MNSMYIDNGEFCVDLDEYTTLRAERLCDLEDALDWVENMTDCQ